MTTPAAHLGLTPRRRVRVPRHRRRPSCDAYRDDPPGRHDRDLGPVGRHAARVRPGRRRTPRWRSSPVPIRTGEEAARVAPGERHVRAFRRRRPLPVQRADVERRHPVHPQAVHRRGQPARPGLRLRPGRAGYTGLLTGRKAAVVYTSAVYGAGRRPGLRLRLPAAVLRGLAALGGCRRHHVDRLPARTWPPPTPTRGRQAAHAAARDAGKLF